MKLSFKRNLLLLIFLMGIISGWSQITIGTDAKPAEGALLDLKQGPDRTGNGSDNSDKGLLLPRVKLQNLTSLTPLVSAASETEKLKHKGTIVYNVMVNSSLREGLYQWNGRKWDAMVTEIPKNMVKTARLLTNTTTTLGYANGSGGVNLNFDQIIIPEDGAYAFSFRLYGKVSGITATPVRCVYYISLWANGNLIDIAEINLFVAESGLSTDYTYSITLGANLTEGSNITFKLSHAYSETPTVKPWELYSSPNTVANRTTMVWWKL